MVTNVNYGRQMKNEKKSINLMFKEVSLSGEARKQISNMNILLTNSAENKNA